MTSAKDMETKSEQKEERRLWIGNLDPRVTEYHLLKLLQKHGAIEKFDLLFHRSGPQAGQPRGYAFVTYVKQVDAVSARDALNNVLVGQKVLKVTWANCMPTDDVDKPKVNVNIPVLAMAKSEPKLDRNSKIQAIEAKLQLMEKRAEDELKINDTVATKAPVVTQFQHNKQQISGQEGGSTHVPTIRQKLLASKRHDRHKPYTRHKNCR